MSHESLWLGASWSYTWCVPPCGPHSHHQQVPGETRLQLKSFFLPSWAHLSLHKMHLSNRECYLHHPSLHTNTSGQQEYLCLDAICGLFFCTQPSKLMSKLSDLGNSTSLCNWTLKPHLLFPEHRSPTRLCSQSSPILTVHLRLCPFEPSNIIVKFADDITVVDMISRNNKEVCRKEVEHLAACNASSTVHSTVTEESTASTIYHD